MEERANQSVAFSHIGILAAFSLVALIGVVAWQVGQLFLKGEVVSATNGATSALSERAATPYGSINWQAPLVDEEGDSLVADGEASDPDGIGNIAENIAGALIGSYVALADTGSYTPEEGEKIAGSIAESLRASVSYKSYTAADLKTDTDTSYERMLTYRNDLRIALEPLLGNPGYELSIFANYIGTSEAKYLEQLQTAVQNYTKATEAAAKVTVPQDAVSYHVEILNALSEFGATIERMSQHADDAFASAALLRTYNDSESRLMMAFNSLATYYTGKQP